MSNPDGSLQGEPVEGDGVIGKFPILVPGQEEFSYQSCTHQNEGVTLMDGSFAFVEGSIMQPNGPRFDVKCPRMVLEVPQYFY
jgi:F-box protein 3